MSSVTKKQLLDWLHEGKLKTLTGCLRELVQTADSADLTTRIALLSSQYHRLVADHAGSALQEHDYRSGIARLSGGLLNIIESLPGQNWETGADWESVARQESPVSAGKKKAVGWELFTRIAIVIGALGSLAEFLGWIDVTPWGSKKEAPVHVAEKQDENLGLVHGVVEDHLGRPVSGALVMIDRDTTTYTDSLGRFRLLLPEQKRVKNVQDKYLLKVSKTGFRSVEEFYFPQIRPTVICMDCNG